ncbi:nicotinate-nucleotide--dimethylbenzimidazole phosphoribosyltransferase [Phenylobacterium sp.]|uniref:nicotinate-nucleotide--dimethylbenzimidazole phosphoribosyltransferase n=1 Tax=Phenylobacterium sp. TaxID=1871053 RepID=UPI002FD93AA3
MSLPPLPPLDRGAEPALRARLDAKAKPPGALGRLEDLAVELALIQGRDHPCADQAVLMVFAGDHGLNAEGVSAYPSAVTKAMVATLLDQGASANTLARAVGAQVRVIDAGVAADLAPHPDLIARKVRKGSRNAAREDALSAAEVDEALAHGAALAADGDADILLLGEMGIGNSASAALIIHRLAPAPLAECIGPGAGHDAAGMARKRTVLAAAAARTDASEAHAVLRAFAGLEIAMMAGAVLGAAAARRPVVIDGFICTAAALAAVRLSPAAREVCIFAHRSAEPGHDVALRALGAHPLLDLGLRLGEGTGGLMALPLLRGACALLNEGATLAEVLARSEGP